MTQHEPRYSVTVKRQLIAQHFLVGGDWGRENERNSHRYEIQARYEGSSLDRHGFLVDIDAINGMLDGLVDRYRDRTLNELPEFDGLNPSVEHFARILSDQLVVTAPNVDRLEVTVWEDDAASAAYRRTLDATA
ncbi:MAG: 6-pyruvoyltetrahydropterin/6-carboxytetrahydropterin synthase [Solirubrobacteraceae bacterium]|jgi:6-pyruvoyltetrahydropterin/6-carboxytetrahydropterin synthase|nr:6-pyruvoyltetrahydropterin/6-carboxytetrahydropterin synthase [Solirubrobacteraceae bacterium]